MNTSTVFKLYSNVLLSIVLLTSCAISSPDTPGPDPTSTLSPKSCESIEGTCMKLSFDIDRNCIYEGPESVSTKNVTLIFVNESGSIAAVNMVRHTGDESIQDKIDYLGEEPSSKHHPNWSEEVGTWKLINSGMIHIWEGELDPGIHTVVCASPKHGVWHGGGFEVDY